MNTKIGISACVIAALAYIVSFFSGYFALLLILGYVCICENNDWLKFNVAKAVIVTACFSIIGALIGLIPNLISVINGLFGLWGGHFSLAFISALVAFINAILVVVEKVVMLGLAFFAFKGKNINVPGVDTLAQLFINFKLK